MLTAGLNVIVLEEKDFRLSKEEEEIFAVPFGLRSDMLLIPSTYKDVLKDSFVYGRIRGNTHVGSKLKSELIYYEVKQY